MGPSSRFSATGMGDLEILWEDSRLAFCRGGRHPTEGGRSGVQVGLPTSEQPISATVDRLDRGASVVGSDEERKQLAELKSRDLG